MGIDNNEIIATPLKYKIWNRRYNKAPALAEALLFELVPEVGLEPTLPKETDFESVVYTNFTTRALYSQ